MSYFLNRDKLVNKKVIDKLVHLFLLATPFIIAYCLFNFAIDQDIESKEKLYTFNITLMVGEEEAEPYIKLEDIMKYKEFNTMLYATITKNNIEYVRAKTIKNIVNKTIDTLPLQEQDRTIISSKINYEDNIIEIYKDVYVFSRTIKALSFIFSLIISIVGLVGLIVFFLYTGEAQPTS